jgi:nitrite reductase/ring-hydroxylating ferredoxin subunit
MYIALSSTGSGRSPCALSSRAPITGEAGAQPPVTLVPLGAPRGRGSWIIRHNGRRYAVFAVGGELEVTDAACPHNGGPLARGIVRDGVVTCPWHWYRFELESGLCLTWAGYKLQKYPVVHRDGRSYAALPGELRRRGWHELLRGVTARLRRRGSPPG